MSMSNYSKGHERDENRRMNKGLAHSLFAVLFCWLPFVGLALAVSGFLRVVVRVTDAYRSKKALLMVVTLAVLAGCIGVLGAEVYSYVRDPGILDESVNSAWYALTGQEQPPWALSAAPLGTDPEDDFAGYGDDPFAVDMDDYDDGLNTGDDWTDYDADWDADFDDSELAGFNEDDTAEDEPSQKALYDQMRSATPSLLPGG